MVRRRGSGFGSSLGKVNLWVAGIKVKVEGKENLPIGSSAGDDECGFIIAANHTSAADIFAILEKEGRP